MSTMHRRTSILAAVLACFLAASLAVRQTHSAKAEQAGSTATVPAAENKPAPVLQTQKMYTARAVLRIPLGTSNMLSGGGFEGGGGGVTGTTGVGGGYKGMSGQMGALRKVLEDVLSSSETYRVADPHETEDQRLSRATRTKMTGFEWLGDSLFVTIESSSANSAEALRDVVLASSQIKIALDAQIREMLLQDKHEMPLNPAELQELRQKSQRVTTDVLATFARFGSYADAATAVEALRKEKENLDKELQGNLENIRRAEMDLAGAKALADSVEQRLAKEAEAAQKAEKEDPIALELQTLVDLAENDYTRVAKLAERGVAGTEEVNQKKKTVAESRLALLRRKEELSNRATGPEFAKLKEQLISSEQQVVLVEARRASWINRANELRAEVAKFSESLSKAQPLLNEIADLKIKLQRQDELGQLPTTTIVVPPSLVAQN